MIKKLSTLLFKAVINVIALAVVRGLFLGTVTFFVAGLAAPAAFLAEWTWSQHVAACALLAMYGAAIAPMQS